MPYPPGTWLIFASPTLCAKVGCVHRTYRWEDKYQPMEGAGLQRVGGLCRTPPGNCKPLLPCADTTARRHLHAAPLEVDCALRPAAGRGSARPSRRLGRSAGHAHMAWSVALKWCHSTVCPAGGSQTAVVAGHGKHFEHPPHLGKWLILQNSNTSGSTWHGRRTSVSLHAEDPHRTLVSAVWWMSPPLSGPVTHRVISPVTHITAAGSLHRQPLWQSPHRPASRTPSASAGRCTNTKDEAGFAPCLRAFYISRAWRSVHPARVVRDLRSLGLGPGGHSPESWRTQWRPTARPPPRPVAELQVGHEVGSEVIQTVRHSSAHEMVNSHTEHIHGAVPTIGTIWVADLHG